jgi:hypothetical protein
MCCLQSFELRMTHEESSRIDNRQGLRGRYPPRKMVIPTIAPPRITIARPMRHGR